MKTFRWGLFIIALDAIALVALIFIYPHLMISAGPVLAGHEALASDCFACHAPLRGASAERCIACHVVADIGLRTTKGVALPVKAAAAVKASFHQKLLQADCMACHSDHKGAKPPLRGFTHALIAPAAREQCEACHAKPTDPLHRKITGLCQQCHGTQAWKPATFAHEKYFVLDRDHNAECATCHKGQDFKQYTCYGCHEHTLANVTREHEKEGIADFENCVECHRSAQDEPKKGGKKGGRNGGKERD